MNDCVICRLIAEEIEVTKIYEDDFVTAVMDIQPINPGHLFISPKQHFEFISQLDDELGAHIFKVAMRLGNALRNSGLRCDGVNFFIADGKAAMQEVPHVHLHVIPRIEGDGFGFRFDKSYFMKPKREELVEIGNMIKGALNK